MTHQWTLDHLVLGTCVEIEQNCFHNIETAGNGQSSKIRQIVNRTYLSVLCGSIRSIWRNRIHVHRPQHQPVSHNYSEPAPYWLSQQIYWLAYNGQTAVWSADHRFYFYHLFSKFIEINIQTNTFLFLL